MSAEYSVEEVRAQRDGLRSGNYSKADLLHIQRMLTALLERIRADEGAVAVAYQSKRHPEDYPDEWRECSKEIFDTINRTKDSPWITRELFVRPPAQAAHVDPAAKPRTLADFINAPDAERAQIGQQVAARMDEMMAEPVAQPADSGRVPDGWVLVPREPTAAMLDAAMTREDDEPLTDWGKIIPAPHAEIYKAMLAAAPQPGESA